MADERLENSRVDLTPKRSFLAPLEDEIREKAKEDPFARFLLEGWKQFAIILLAAGAIMYLRQAYTNTQEKSRQYSADRYAQLRGEFAELRDISLPEAKPEADKGKQPEAGDQAKKKEELEQKMEEALKAQEEVRQPYSELFSVYRLLLGEMAGKPVAAPVSVDSLPVENDSPARLADELSLIITARQKLAGPDTAMEGRKILRQLSETGAFVNIGAAISLARAAATSEERSDALSVLKTLKEKRPEQAKLLDPEIEGLGAGAEQG